MKLTIYLDGDPTNTLSKEIYSLDLTEKEEADIILNKEKIELPGYENPYLFISKPCGPGYHIAIWDGEKPLVSTASWVHEHYSNTRVHMTPDYYLNIHIEKNGIQPVETLNSEAAPQN
ncbi:MAG: hypothetical protein AAF065_14640 [Verrucomicrobiota bacterium]